MNDLNLLPESYVKQRLRHRLDLLCVVLFVVVMVSIIITERVSRRRFQQIRLIHTQVGAKFSGAAEFVNNFFMLQGTRSRLLREAEIASAMEEHVPRSYLLAVVTNARCGTVCLTSMNVETHEVRPSGAAGDMGSTGSKGKTHKSSRKKREKKNLEKQTQMPPPSVITIKLQGISETDEDIASFVAALRKSPLLEEVKWRYAREARVQVQGVAFLCRKFEVEIIVKKNIDVLDVINEEGQAGLPSTVPTETPVGPIVEEGKP